MKVDRISQVMMFVARCRLLSAAVLICGIALHLPRSPFTPWSLIAAAVPFVALAAFAWWNDARYLREMAEIEADYRAAIARIAPDTPTAGITRSTALEP